MNAFTVASQRVELALVLTYPDGRITELELDPVTVPITAEQADDTTGQVTVSIDETAVLGAIAASLRTGADQIERVAAGEEP